jgi:hypothetical protein
VTLTQNSGITRNTIKEGKKMKMKIAAALEALLIISMSVIVGCSKSTGPVATNDTSLNSESVLVQSLTVVNVVTQDLAQLDKAGAVTSSSYGVFSIGWNQFIGPNIVDAGTIGKAFVVVHADTTAVGPAGVDIGAVTLNYDTSNIALTKRTFPRGVLYSTFDRGLRAPRTLPVNIPFIANGTYQFSVSGSTLFTPGTFTISAPASLLKITSNADGDSVGASKNLSITWSGGSPTDSVLLRIIPHLRPEQFEGRGPGRHPGPGHGDGGMMHDGDGGRFGDGGMGPIEDGSPLDLGPEFHRGIVRVIANTGSTTISASDLQLLLNGTASAELMIGVSQLIKKNVQHDNKSLTLLLRNGDRIVVKIQ